MAQKKKKGDKNASCVKAKAANAKLPSVCSKTRFGVTRTASRLRVQGRGPNMDAVSVNIIFSTKQLDLN